MTWARKETREANNDGSSQKRGNLSNENTAKARSRVAKGALRNEAGYWQFPMHALHGLITDYIPSQLRSVASRGLLLPLHKGRLSQPLYPTGVEVMAGLELAYLGGIMVWDSIPESMLAMVHPHNMLVQRGYITRLGDIYATLQDIFKDEFFADGVALQSHFIEGLMDRAGDKTSKRSKLICRHPSPAQGITYAHMFFHSNVAFAPILFSGLEPREDWRHRCTRCHFAGLGSPIPNKNNL